MIFISCVSKLLYIVNRSSSKKEQLKLHRSLLGVKRGGGKNSPMNSPLSNIIAVTVKINILDKVPHTHQILLEDVHKNIVHSFLKLWGGGGGRPKRIL